MNTICIYFIYFIIYSFIGWLLEVTCKLIELKKFVNRGFLIGPICPIYGCGVLGIITILNLFKGSNDILSVFLKSILVCSILEYCTSYLMEKLFDLRWWDYSRRKFNLNGRICLDTMIPFGLLGVCLQYYVHPFISNYVNTIIVNSGLLYSISFIIFIIFIIDNIFSFVVMKKIKNEIKDNQKDNTVAIKDYMDTWLETNSMFYRRLRNAYPNFKINLKEISEKVKDIEYQYKNMFVNNANQLKKNYYENKKILKAIYKKNKKKIK